MDPISVDSIRTELIAIWRIEFQLHYSIKSELDQLVFKWWPSNGLHPNYTHSVSMFSIEYRFISNDNIMFENYFNDMFLQEEEDWVFV